MHRIGLGRHVIGLEDLGDGVSGVWTGQHPADRVDLFLDDAIGSHEVAHRQLVVRGDLGHVVVPDEGRSIGCKHLAYG